jgi:aryl-alcohol dehydrogenase-like predicted oxidoreductase
VPPTPTRYSTSLTPSKLALGAARLGAFWQGNSLPESVRTLQSALEGGINVLDTADGYALGISERIIGAVLRSQRSQTWLCTKVGQLKTPLATLQAHRAESRLTLHSLRAAIPRRTPADISSVPRCYASAYIEIALRRSLKRLRTERVDALLLHSPSLSELREERFADAARRLLAAGDIAHFGVSCDTHEIALAAAQLPYVAFVEVPMDCTSDENLGVAARLAAHGVGVLARSPFGGGKIAATLTREFGAFSADLAACCLQAVTDIPSVFTTIVGMSSPQRVHENLALLAREVAPETRARVQRALRGTAAPSLTSEESAS